MEMDASFGEWQRSASHVLSFSTSVLLFRGIAMQISLPFGYRCFVVEEKWSCFVDRFFCCAVSTHPTPTPAPTPAAHLFFSLLHWFFFIYIFFLELGCQEKEGKKEWKINREAQSDPVVSVRFPFQAFEEKHLSGGGMRPNCSQSLLILPVQSPRGAEGEGQGGVAGSYRHLAMTSRLHSCPLKLGLFSLNCSEARRRATVWLTTNPRGIFIRHSSHCRTANGFNSPN